MCFHLPTVLYSDTWVLTISAPVKHVSFVIAQRDRQVRR